jgi:hypothetical protein
MVEIRADLFDNCKKYNNNKHMNLERQYTYKVHEYNASWLTKII